EVGSSKAIKARLEVVKCDSFADVVECGASCSFGFDLRKEGLKGLDEERQVRRITYDGAVSRNEDCGMKVDHLLQSDRPFGHIGAEGEGRRIDKGVPREQEFRVGQPNDCVATGVCAAEPHYLDFASAETERELIFEADGWGRVNGEGNFRVDSLKSGSNM